MEERKKRISAVDCSAKYVKLVQEGTLEAVLDVRRKFDDEGLRTLQYRGKMEAKVASLENRLKTFEGGVKITPFFVMVSISLGCLGGFYPSLFRPIMILVGMCSFGLSLLAKAQEKATFYILLGLVLNWLGYLGGDCFFDAAAVLIKRREGRAFLLVSLLFWTQNMHELGCAYLALPAYIRQKREAKIALEAREDDTTAVLLNIFRPSEKNPVAAKDVLNFLKEKTPHFKGCSTLKINHMLREAGFESAGGARKKNLFWFLELKRGGTIPREAPKDAEEVFLREKNGN